MQIPRATIVGFLRKQGKDALADQAERRLPEQIDPAQYAEQLQRMGVDVPALLEKLPAPLRRLFGGR
jgi:hypothetical protein